MGYNDPMLILTLRLGENTIVIGGDSPYQLLSSGLRGTEGADVALSLSEHAQLDGAMAVTCRVPGREITLDFEIADHKNREKYRRSLLSFFAPRSVGTLTVSRVGGEMRDRTVGCILYGAIVMTQETVRDFIRVRVPLYCPDPYFHEDREPRILSKTGNALLTFPLTITENAPLTASEEVVSAQLTVNNTGDTETGFLLTLKATEQTAGAGAEIVNPCITRSSDGVFIRVYETLHTGDVLTICTLPGAKYILLNGERRMNFDRNSTFFTLNRGSNHTVLSADSKRGHLEAVLSYRTRHFGA